MRKITLLLASLFITIGAMAQVTDLGTITDDKVYTIESARGFLMYNADINANSIITPNAKAITSENTGLKVKNSANEGQQFQIKTVDGARYLYSVAAGKYLAEGNTLTETPRNALTITETSDATYKWFLKVGSHGLNTQEANQTDEGIQVNSWVTVDAGNRFRLLEVDEVHSITAASLSQFDMGRVYTATTVDRGAWTVKNDLSAFASTSDAGQSVDATNNKQQFAMVSENGTDFYIYSVAAKKFVNHDKSLSENPSEPIEVTAGTGSYAGRLRVNFKGINNSYINHGGSNQMTIDNWSTIDNGNAIQFSEVATFDPTEALSKFMNVEANYKLVDNAGNAFEGTFTFKGNNTPAVSGAFGATITNGSYDAEQNLYTATINFAYPMSKVGGATNETLLSMKNENNHKYIRGVGNNVKVQSTATSAVDANCLWAIYPTFNNGAFTFAIMNVATGKYIHTDATEAVHATEGTVVLSTEPTMFTIGGDYEFKANNLYLSINSPRDDQDVFLGVYGSTHNGSNIYHTALPQYNVAITSAKYATFYAPVAVNVPENVTAYTVTINEGGWADLNEVGTTIPAYTGVVLYSETANTYTFNVVATNADAPIADNALNGTVAATYITADAYVLGIKNNEVGFYTATTEGQAEGTFLNNHHKAYLPKITGMNAASYSFRFPGTTAIEDVELENEVKAIYDLSGRRVENITAPGIYIVNGVKVLVK